MSSHEPLFPEQPPTTPALPPRAPQAPHQVPVPPRRGRAGFAAAVVALALITGGAAGLGGAAAYDAWNGDEAGSSSAGAPASSAEPASAAQEDAVPAPESTIEAVAAEVLPSVVKIDVRGATGAGSGSGIVLSEDGRILTNQHVVELAEQGGTLTVSFDDGRTVPGTVVGSDPLTDIAVVQAEADGLTPIDVGRSGDLRVGQDVVAVGSPYGLDSTVTSGIVSALDRPVNVGSTPDGASTTYPAIQTDAAINPGNSGGPLVDLEGQLVGINSSIRTAAGSAGGAGSIGLGFAIPIDAILPIVDQIVAGEEPTHARLGISVADVGAAPVPGLEDPSSSLPVGALVREVGAGSTAEGAGIAAGDVITRVDGRPITGADSLVAQIRAYRPGDEVEVVWVRDGEEQSATLVLDSDGEE